MKKAHRQTAQDIYLLHITLFYSVALSQLHRLVYVTECWIPYIK